MISREPAQATPKRAPSSSPKLTTPIGRAGVNPLLAQGIQRGEGRHDTERAVERAAVGHRVEVRADHDAGPSVSGSPRQAHWLPARSSTTSSPRAAASPANHSRSVASSRVQAKRR